MKHKVVAVVTVNNSHWNFRIFTGQHLKVSTVLPLVKNVTYGTPVAESSSYTRADVLIALDSRKLPLLHVHTHTHTLVLLPEACLVASISVLEAILASVFIGHAPLFFNGYIIPHWNLTSIPLLPHSTPPSPPPPPRP